MRRTTGVVATAVDGGTTASAPSTHPLAATLQRGRELTHGGYDLSVPLGDTSEDGWVPVAALLGDARKLDGTLAAFGREVGSERRDVQASLLLEAYAWRLILPLAGALLAESRVPTPGLDGTAVRLTGDGLPCSIRLLHARFAALPGDPATEHPDADVVCNRSVLDRCLRSWLIAHFDPFVEKLNAASGRPRAALWRSVADRTATALLYAGLASNRPAAAKAIAERTLAGDPPLRHPPRYIEIGGQSVHLRHGCCLWWRTDAATTCLTCPLRVARSTRAAPCIERAESPPAAG
jgi:ferric iron reductase protein FhuF